MKKINYLLLLGIACSALTISSCSSDGKIIDEKATTNTTPTAVTFVVPVGSTSVWVRYKTNAGIDSTKVAITPGTNYSETKGASPFVKQTLTISSPNNAYVDILDDQNNLLVQNLPVKAVTTSRAANASVVLPETAVAKYVTTDEAQTFYHSSGVAMFDDSWPSSPATTKGRGIDTDYNDVVIDYDIEARTVDDVIGNAKNAWREEVKVVMHVRAMGGLFPRTAGLVLEGLNTKYITSKEEFITLGNYNNPFNGGQIPANSLSESVDMTGEHPMITIKNLDWLRSAAAHTATYDRDGKTWVVNRTTKDPSQYNPDSIKIFDNTEYYNTNPGYINAGGALYTVTIVFHYADRSGLDATTSAAQLADMINGVIDTNSQNFFITAQNGGNNYEIHMKGYEPTTAYASKYSAAAATGVAKSTTAKYCAANGFVWGFKTPVLTRHAWEKYSFDQTYPQFAEWQTSNGTKNTEWYKAENANGVYMSCWW